MFFTRHVQAERRTNRILTVGDDFAESYYPHSSWILFPGYKTSWEEAQWILNSLRGHPAPARTAGRRRILQRGAGH